MCGCCSSCWYTYFDQYRFLNAAGYLEFWHAILIDLGSLLVVVLNGTRILQVRAFAQAESTTAAPAMVLAVAEAKLEVESLV